MTGVKHDAFINHNLTLHKLKKSQQFHKSITFDGHSISDTLLEDLQQMKAMVSSIGLYLQITISLLI